MALGLFVAATVIFLSTGGPGSAALASALVGASAMTAGSSAAVVLSHGESIGKAISRLGLPKKWSSYLSTSRSIRSQLNGKPPAAPPPLHGMPHPQSFRLTALQRTVDIVAKGERIHPYDHQQPCLDYHGMECLENRSAKVSNEIFCRFQTTVSRRQAVASLRGCVLQALGRGELSHRLRQRNIIRKRARMRLCKNKTHAIPVDASLGYRGIGSKLSVMMELF